MTVLSWPAELDKHERAVVGDLYAGPATHPSPDAIRRTMALPAFQRGAKYVRALRPCQRPAQCTEFGCGPESCRLCNPQNATRD